MGDADSTHMMPVEEIQNWIDEALRETDDGLDNLLALIYALNRRTQKVSSELTSWRLLKECFTALNLFVVPVVFAIWIACAVNDYTGQETSQEGSLSVVLQAVGIILMFVSGVIGLPLYVYSSFKMYYLQNNNMTNIPSKGLRRESESSVEGRLEDENTLARDFVQSLSEIRRITNRRYVDSVRQDIEWRVEQATNRAEEARERSFESLTSRSEIFDVSKDGETQQSEQQSGREDTGFTESTVIERELGDYCGLKLTIMSNRPSMTVEIEGEKNDTNHQHQQQIVDSKPARDIQVESFGL